MTTDTITFVIPPDLKKLNLCACMGPTKGEPYCPCRMIREGLKTEADYAWTPEEKADFVQALQPFFELNRRTKS